MFWNKRRLPAPNDAQIHLEKAYDLIKRLMFSRYSMPSSISRGMDDWLDNYYDLEKDEYEKN